MWGKCLWPPDQTLHQYSKPHQLLLIISFHMHTSSYFIPLTTTVSSSFTSSPKMVLQGHLVVNLITKHDNNNLCPDFMFLLCFASETGTVKDQGSWGGDNGDKEISYLLQLIMMSSGLMRRFSMPIFGWSPRPRKRPGGSMRKFPILSLWLSMMQKPYSWRSRSFSSLIFYKMYEDILRNPRVLEVGRVHLTAIPVSPL